jgi:pimeloyl-ACP methyl ester carboxylesterase
VLVHGDWADGSSWSAVISRLQRQGYPVVAPPNQLRGPSVDAPYLASYLQTIPGPIILVGHSYGGFVITNAATGNGHVKALVYIDAFIPDANQTLADLSSPEDDLRSLHPPEVRIAIVLDNFSPHRSTNNDTRVGDWAAANNVELAYVPFYASWLNRIEAQFTALRYFALDGTDHPTHQAQARMIRRYIAWRNRHAADQALRELVNRANVA